MAKKSKRLLPARGGGASTAKRKRPAADALTKRAPDTLGSRSEREPDLLSNALGYILKRAQVRCDEALMAYLKQQISPARLVALSAVGNQPGINQAALANLLGIAGPSVVAVVDDLEARGYLQRMATNDRRVSALHLTKPGRTALSAYLAGVDRCEVQITSGLTKAERQRLLLLLKKVAVNDALTGR